MNIFMLNENHLKIHKELKRLIVYKKGRSFTSP